MIKRNKILMLIGMFVAAFLIGGGFFFNEEEVELSLKLNSEQSISKDKDLTVLVASDLHYLSPDFIEEGILHDSLLNDGDGKMTHRSEEIVDTFIEEVIEINPDLVILSGDLTFDGEMKSHEELADKLNHLVEKGIQVNVIPGNHDVNVYSARGFTKDATYRVDSISSEEFEEMYWNHGYSTSVSRDSESLSYVTELSESTWLIMLDSNKYREHNQHRKSIPSGVIQKETLEWLEFILEESEKHQVNPIVVAHHNFLNHHHKMSAGFTLDNDREVVDLLNKYKVPLTFSGHIPLQHIAKEENFYDIASGSLSVYPNYFGKVSIDFKDRQLTYETKRLKGSPRFQEDSEAFFDEVSRRKVLSRLDKEDLDTEVLNQLADTFVLFNNAYFAGTVQENYHEITESEGFDYWEKLTNLRYHDYIMNGLEEERLEGNFLQISY